MALVSEKTYMEWTKKDHWIRKNFEYVYNNPLWKMESPNQYSLCTYFWKSIIIGMVFMRLVVVPFGLVAGFILGKTCSPVGGLLYRQWKPVFDEYDDDTFSMNESAILGYLFTILAILVTLGIFSISLLISSILVELDYGQIDLSNVGLAVMLFGFLGCALVASVGALTNLMYPAFFREKKLSMRLVQMLIVYGFAVLISNAVGIGSAILEMIAAIAIAAWPIVTDPFIMVFEAFSVVMLWMYWQNVRNIRMYEAEWRMVTSDYVYFMSVFLAMSEEEVLDLMFSEAGFDIGSVHDKQAFNMRIDLAKKIMLKYDHRVYDFYEDCIKIHNNGHDAYMKAMDTMKQEIDRGRRFPSFADRILDTVRLSSMFTQCRIYSPDFCISIARQVVDGNANNIRIDAEREFHKLLEPNVLDRMWGSLSAAVKGSWQFAMDLIRAKKAGMCPVLNLEQEGE